MKIKDITEVGLLLAIGFMLHSFFPPVLLGMKPDFTLAMLFAVIIIKRDFKLAILAGLATGIFTALTTGFPGGQVANMVDKIVTTSLVTLVVLQVRSTSLFFVGAVNCIGTIVSGAIFLGTAAIFFGLPGSLFVLMLTVVLPAALVNTVAGTILFSAVTQSKRMLHQMR